MIIRKVACVGAGLIGASWATLFAKEGFPVNLYDALPEGLESARGRISNWLKQLSEYGVLTEQAAEDVFGRIVFTSDLKGAVEGADFIQESVPEILEVKQSVLGEIDKYNTAAIFASSTSGMRISDIAGLSRYACRCIGAHPYNPPHLVPLVELTKSPQTNQAVLEAAKTFYRSVKKEPVVLKKEAIGFIGNRLQEAIAREIINIVMLGIESLEDVDKAAVYGPGIRGAIIGPMLTKELNGGADGIKGFYAKFGKAVSATFNDNMASWTTVPPEFIETIGPEGVAEEKRNRSEEEGKTNEEIAGYRDGMLIEMLKLHNKV